MAMCPLCNSFKDLEIYCLTCSSQLDDSGKVSDFFDPYAHYNDIETIRMHDGYPKTKRDQICAHLMHCRTCGYDEVKFIQEE